LRKLLNGDEIIEAANRY